MKMKQLMQEACTNTDVRHAVDLGCSTGLSTLELHQAFPEAQITAVDLSPYFITVARHDQRQRQVRQCTVTFLTATEHLFSCRVSLLRHHWLFAKLAVNQRFGLNQETECQRLVHQPAYNHCTVNDASSG